MTDAELIAEARERERDAYQNHRTQKVLTALADRLEQLTQPRPLPPSPMTETRLAEIRSWRNEGEPWDVCSEGLKDACEDLLALVDHLLDRADALEACLADVAMDEGARLARADGVAAALAVVGRIHAEYCRRRHLEDEFAGAAYDMDSAHAGAAKHILDRVRIECDDPEPSPHSVSLARLRKRTAALERIAAGDFNGGQALTIAAQALKGDA